jgi:type I restriction enzyme, S subunit
VRVADFDRTRFIAGPGAETIRSVPPSQLRTRLLRCGDVLLEKSGGTGDKPVGCAVNYDLDIPAVCSNFIAVLRPLEGNHPRFVGLLMASLYLTRQNEPFVKRTTGIQNLDSSAYLSSWVSVPPLAEQQQIVAYLDAETNHVDMVTSELRQLVRLLDEHERAAIDAHIWGQSTDTCKTVPMWHMTEPERPIMYGIVLPGPDVADGVLLVKGGDVRPDRLDPELLNRTTQEIEAPYARARLREADVVYAIRGSIGEAALVPASLSDANITQDVARISPSPGVHPRWLLYAVRSARFLAQMESEARGATIRGVNIWSLKKGRVPEVTLREQVQIAERLDRICQEIDTTRSELRTQLGLLHERRQSLVSAAVTGQLKFNGSAA